MLPFHSYFNKGFWGEQTGEKGQGSKGMRSLAIKNVFRHKKQWHPRKKCGEVGMHGIEKKPFTILCFEEYFK